MKKFLVIGNPIEHSLSPKLHNYWINQNNIDGIGLFRTEYLYTDRSDFPSENEQVKAYKTIVKKMKSLSLIHI